MNGKRTPQSGRLHRNQRRLDVLGRELRALDAKFHNRRFDDEAEREWNRLIGEYDKLNDHLGPASVSGR